ncbi:MAG: hypothetical protein M1828_006763 [Chrysothrix sp. TS-e1954]|nr:MAG: hypothetical protein M1828_006763 [Chrysothrix sp. TS-e1954]
MATTAIATPQRPLPGQFFNTPALTRQASGSQPIQPINFRGSSTPSNTQQGQQVSYPQLSGPPGAAPAQAPKGLSLIERAARTINTTLEEESRFPPIENYIAQGSSSDYDIPSSQAWAPFQRIKVHEIPDQIFEQYNQAQVSTMMGLLADVHHAWITIDNALYMWDYTHPNPELLGFEEQPNSITAVKLVRPRPGVFVDAITRLLVIATTSDIFLVGVASSQTAAGASKVSLFQTRMQVSVRGINVQCIEGSDATGRIFFCGRGNDDIYEITYQQEEKWFQSRCAKVNHMQSGIQTILPNIPSISFRQQEQPEFVTQMVIDDSRKSLYTLSSKSTIRVFALSGTNGLEHNITRDFGRLLNDLGHRVSSTTLLNPQTAIVSISTISEIESPRLNLVAVTSTGCRIYFSAVSSSYVGGTSSGTVSSMQVHHCKFPPRDPSQPQTSQQPAAPSQALQIQGQGAPGGETSTSLTTTRIGNRFAPGYFLFIVQRQPQARNDLLFMSAPDAGRIAHPQDPSQANRFPEFGMWMPLEGRAEDQGLVTAPFAASSNSRGFGNELAVQFDKSGSEFAILTNSGIHTFRRRRFVDIFAAAIRYGGGDEGLEGEIRNMIRLYGRGEAIATALAVACGQGSDVAPDSRVVKVKDPEVLDFARKAFVDFGGKPGFAENAFVDRNAPSVDDVRPSPRHEGLAIYTARLLRSVWKAPILLERSSPTGGLQVLSVVRLSKLQNVQHDLSELKNFLDKNRMAIEGLAGPDALGRVSTKQEEVALQGEHRALSSIVRLVNECIEGIAFVLMLFEERVEEVVLSLTPESRRQLNQTSFEQLFCTSQGKDLAKELVKAVVNRNIASGSNVDTVTDSLRRRCGSFCSPDDCVIFKAQEQLKRAGDSSSSSETSRNLLNESLRLLQRVAASLSMEQLRWAVEQYNSLQFYAGAIQLVLAVAQESDRGNRALSWVQEGSPGQDSREALFEKRTRCYDIIHSIITSVDQTAGSAPEMVDGYYTVTAKRKREAYDVINESQDELFQFNLYDWYLAQGWTNRLLEVRSPFVINYLRRKSQEDEARADLLWKYHAHYNNFLEAAKVQLDLAKSKFQLTLEQRIEYLSCAKANASTKTIGMSEAGQPRQSRQEVIREISDLLDIAMIQQDLLQKFRSEPRLTPEKRPSVIASLNGPIMAVDELYNDYADQASYYDSCLLIYHAADYRNPSDIRSTWQNMLQTVHDNCIAENDIQPYEAVIQKVQEIGRRLNLSETTFPVSTLLPMLERYAHEYQRNAGTASWVVAMFIDLGVAHDILLYTLESMYYAEEAPFKGKQKRVIVVDMLYVIRDWFDKTTTVGARAAFGGEEQAFSVSSILRELGETGLDREVGEQVESVRAKIESIFR